MFSKGLSNTLEPSKAEFDAIKKLLTEVSTLPDTIHALFFYTQMIESGLGVEEAVDVTLREPNK